MCGICGIIGEDEGDVLQRMLQRLVHRGPDEEGIYRQLGAALGARRLRAIDPEGGHQPASNREMVHDLLADDVIKDRGCVKPAYVRWLLEMHERSRRNCSDQLYALMVLELWHRGLRAGSSERMAEVVTS